MKNDRFLRACRREPVDTTPVWFMRQAGRYMPVYRALRQRHTIIELCKTPELATEVTMQPIEKFDLDAAIIFADLLLPFEPMGADFEFAKGEGPVIHHPVRTRADVEALRPVVPEEGLGYVLEAIRLTRRALDGRVPLIGFAGAPFTLASYLIEGGGSRHYIHTKRMMQEEPETWHLLMEKLATMSAAFLRAQVEAGAQAVQLFDSWVGCLGPREYREYVLPHSKAVFDALADVGVPRIHFGTGTSTFLDQIREAGGDVIGVDWRIDLDVAWETIGHDRAVQGNLDPIALFGPVPLLEKRIAEILQRVAGRPGHIFNLGHGILPETPEENVAAAIDFVHAWKPQ